MSKIVLVGEAPGPEGRADCPLFPYPAGSTGQRLQNITGLPRSRYLAAFDRVDLLAEYPGPHFPIGAGTASAKNLLASLLRGRRIIAVGKNVARCFGAEDDYQLCEWYPLPGGGSLALIPHTSGRNLWYNFAPNRELVKSFFRKEAKDVQE